MTAFPLVIYDLEELRLRMPALQRPVIDTAISELRRMWRELNMHEAALRAERTPRHIAQIENVL